MVCRGVSVCVRVAAAVVANDDDDDDDDMFLVYMTRSGHVRPLCPSAPYCVQQLAISSTIVGNCSQAGRPVSMF